ncbi:MAG: bifunctional riboflavin kinase/FAD synthetase [Akkermansiaceae bacterium]
MFVRLESLDGIRTIEEPLHLAMGVFDGVHIGHRTVIQEAINSAQSMGGKAMVVTFFPHPIRVIAPEKAPDTLLATIREKAAVIEDMGADGIVVLPFDKAFAKTQANDFIERLCENDVKSISVGEDWRFGRERSGDVVALQKMSSEYGFRLNSVRSVMLDGERVSSTRIRQAIRDGNFEAAKRMLGRPYSISGVVVQGRKIGRELGFPTANLRLGELQVPMNGVWAVEVNGRYRGVANLGFRPTFNGSERLLEVHLFDFEGDLYGKGLKVVFDKYIREEMKFESKEDLQRQIALDVERAQKVTP